MASTEIARRVASRYVSAKTDTVELRRPDGALKSVSLTQGSRGWSYAVQGLSGMRHVHSDKDRGMARAKIRGMMRNQMDIVNTDRILDELDKKFDAGHRAPSKKQQQQQLMEDLKKRMLSRIDYDPELTGFIGSVLWVTTTEQHVRRVRQQLRDMGYGSIKVTDNDDPKYTKTVIADPGDLIQV